MIFNGSIVTSLDKKLKVRYLIMTMKRLKSVYNWLDQKFVDTKLSNRGHTIMSYDTEHYYALHTFLEDDELMKYGTL